MLEKITNLFHNEHAELIAKREASRIEFEMQDKGYADRIETLETRPVHSIREIDQTREEIKQAMADRDNAKSTHRIRDGQLLAKILEAAPPAIDEKIHQLWDEITMSQGQVRISGFVEKSFAGEKGFLDTNSEKIGRRVEAICQAIKKLEALKVVVVSDLRREIARIVETIPALDVSTERVECMPALARGADYPRIIERGA
jgi:hypothetical protein